jgi:hypothetical protein
MAEPTHHVAIAVVTDLTFQAVCNPTKCGWVGSVTDKSMAEFEREMHYLQILDLGTEQPRQ